jgi:hypothetical protein
MPVVEAPRSWPKADKALFAALPMAVQSVIARREAQRDKELQRLQNEVDAMIGRRALRQSADNAAAANGLAPADEKTLRDILSKAGAVERYRALMGGHERQGLDDLVKDTKLRLEPTPVETLNERANEYFGALRQLEWGNRALEGAEHDD